MLGSKFLQNKWNTDFRKFSRYFETSYFSKDLNIGSTVEGNLIFSQESYVPRSAMVNLSVNVFGENLNLFEVGGRVEGLENTIEGMFGPEGHFREDTLQKILKGLRSSYTNPEQRSKREVDGDSAVETLSDFQQTFNNDREEEPKGNLYMRMFGRDMYYDSFNGFSQLFTKASASLWGGIKFPGNDMDYSHSTVFLDGNIVIPTAAGLPLKLAVEGSSNVELKSQTEVNVGDFFKTGRALVEAHVYPTASVLIEGQMSVQFEPRGTSTGLKSVTKLHTSSFLDGKVEISGGKLMKAEINVPPNQLEVVEVSSEFFLVQDEVEVPLQTPKLVPFQVCSSDVYSNMLGLRLCAVGAYSQDPSNYFYPNNRLAIQLYKTDNFDKYTFDYLWSDQDQDGIQEVHLEYDTPGSNINRKSAVEVKFKAMDWSYLDFNLKMPVKGIQANLVYNFERSNPFVKAGLVMDGQTTLLLNGKFKTSKDGHFNSDARLVYFDTEVINWSGTVGVTEKKMSMMATLGSDLLEEPITLQGSDF